MTARTTWHHGRVPRRRGVRAAACLAASAILALTVATASEAAPAGRIVFRIDAPTITESSSLLVSTTHPPLLYTANDSGDGPFVYALDARGGLVGTTTLAGVDPVDVEAMALDGGVLLVGDIGDNDAGRSGVDVFEMPQPAVGNHPVTPGHVRLVYADGAHNAEAMLVDPHSGRLFVITKDVFGGIYESDRSVVPAPAGTVTLRRIASAPPIVTDAAWLVPGRIALVRTYLAVTAYQLPAWRAIASFGLPHQQQGESLAVEPGGDDVLVGSEGTDSPVWRVGLPSSITMTEMPVLGGPGPDPRRGQHQPSSTAVFTGPDTGGFTEAEALVIVSVAAGLVILALFARLALRARRER